MRENLEMIINKIEIKKSCWALDERRLKELYLEDYRTIREIAKYFGVSTTKVAYYLKKYNIRRVERWERYQLKHFTTSQREYLFGSLLGDDSLCKGKARKYPYLSVVHSASQREYVEWKYDIWKQIVPSGIKRNVPIKTSRGVSYTDRFHTAAHPDFEEFFEMFYQNGRKIVSWEILRNLTPFSLAVWYMDDGSYNRHRGRIRIATNSFSHEENNLIRSYFEETWGIGLNIGMVRTNGRRYPYIWFNTGDTIKFFDIIKHHILLPLFDYKIDLKRKLMWKALSEDELEYVRKNYNIEHPQLIAYKLSRSVQSIFNIAHELGVTRPRGGIKRYEKYL